MTLQPLSEYAFGELALSEYSLTEGNYAVSTDFGMVAGTLMSAPAHIVSAIEINTKGMAGAVIRGKGVSVTTLEVTGGSHTLIPILSVTNTETNAQGGTYTRAENGLDFGSSVHTNGGALMSASTQATNHVVISSFGLSAGLVESQYKQIFDTSGHPLSSTALNTHIQAVTQTHHKGGGVGASDLQGHAVTLTSYDEESITTPSIKGGAFHNTKADALTSVVVVVPSLSITHTDYAGTGKSLIDLQTLYKQKMDLATSIKGEGSTNLIGFRKIFIPSEYKGLGEAFLIIPTSVVIDSLINPEGNVELFFERTGYIWGEMDDAFDIILRYKEMS